MESQSLNLQYNIQERAIDSTSYNKKGELINKGDSVHRVVFEGGDERTFFHALSVTDYKSKPWYTLKHLKYVKIHLGDQDIYANVNSLANRLHIEKSKIKHGENLSPLVTKKKEVVGSLVEEFSKIDAKEVKKTQNVSFKKLFKLAVTATENLKAEEGTNLTIGIVAFRKPDSKLSLIFKEKQIGKGSFGSVHSVKERPLVLKTGKNIKNEKEILTKLHGTEKTIPGIQSTPHDFFVIKLEEHSLETGEKEGALFDRLEGNLTKAFEENMEKKLNRAAHLLYGLEFMHSKNIWHRDLKPENILFDEDSTRIADLGNAIDLDKNETVSKQAQYGMPEYSRRKTNTDNTAPEMLMDDVFAMGVVLYQLFAGNEQDFPYQIEQDEYNRLEYPDIENTTPKERETYKQNLREKEVPKEVVDLVGKMIYETKNVSREDLEKAFSTLKTNAPELPDNLPIGYPPLEPIQNL